jgi:hypothetical protein
VTSNSCQDKHSRRFSFFATEPTKRDSVICARKHWRFLRATTRTCIDSCQFTDSGSSRAFAVSTNSTAVTSDQQPSSPFPPTGHSWQLTERLFRLCNKLSRRCPLSLSSWLSDDAASRHDFPAAASFCRTVGFPNGGITKSACQGYHPRRPYSETAWMWEETYILSLDHRLHWVVLLL